MTVQVNMDSYGRWDVQMLQWPEPGDILPWSGIQLQFQMNLLLKEWLHTVTGMEMCILHMSI